MSEPQFLFKLEKRRKTPWIIGAIVVLVALAGTFYVVRHSLGKVEQFGDVLKVHYEPAEAGEERLLDYIAREIAPDYGIKIVAAGLQDFIQADRAVNDGVYAATICQHQWFLQQVVEANGFQLTALLPVFQWGFGLYSNRYRSLKEVPDGATIAVPNDVSNQGQALWILQREGVIGLAGGVEAQTARLRDISSNPHRYVFKELDLMMLPRALTSVDVAIGYISEFDAGKVPRSKAILLPPAPRTFASQLVAATKYVNDPKIIKLSQAFADPRVRTYLETTDDPLVKGVYTPVADQ